MRTEKDNYYSVVRRKQVREESGGLQKRYLRCKEAEIVCSIQHRKFPELAGDAGALYRIDGYVLINRSTFDECLERFRQPPRTKGEATPKISRWKR